MSRSRNLDPEEMTKKNSCKCRDYEAAANEQELNAIYIYVKMSTPATCL